MGEVSSHTLALRHEHCCVRLLSARACVRACGLLFWVLVRFLVLLGWGMTSRWGFLPSCSSSLRPVLVGFSDDLVLANVASAKARRGWLIWPGEEAAGRPPKREGGACACLRPVLQILARDSGINWGFHSSAAGVLINLEVLLGGFARARACWFSADFGRINSSMLLVACSRSF
jgi:hypothetical protein